LARAQRGNQRKISGKIKTKKKYTPLKARSWLHEQEGKTGTKNRILATRAAGK
jgi:hypothetical protein